MDHSLIKALMNRGSNMKILEVDNRKDEISFMVSSFDHIYMGSIKFPEKEATGNLSMNVFTSRGGYKAIDTLNFDSGCHSFSDYHMPFRMFTPESLPFKETYYNDIYNETDPVIMAICARLLLRFRKEELKNSETIRKKLEISAAFSTIDVPIPDRYSRDTMFPFMAWFTDPSHGKEPPRYDDNEDPEEIPKPYENTCSFGSFYYIWKNCENQHYLEVQFGNTVAFDNGCSWSCWGRSLFETLIEQYWNTD